MEKFLQSWHTNTEPVLEVHEGVTVLRDDKLVGGSKVTLMPTIVTGEHDEYVYASPVYGYFQVALSSYCKKIGKKCTIFCAKRKELFPTTQLCIDNGAQVIQVPYGYLSNVEKKARDYCAATGAHKFVFGAHDPVCIDILANRMTQVIDMLGKEPDEIWCAIGSGTLVDSILQATTTAQVFGVQVGAEYKKQHDRLFVYKYHKSFDKASKCPCPFPSVANYDRKVWEYCLSYKSENKDVFLWNVAG